MIDSSPKDVSFGDVYFAGRPIDRRPSQASPELGVWSRGWLQPKRLDPRGLEARHHQQARSAQAQQVGQGPEPIAFEAVVKEQGREILRLPVLLQARQQPP